MEQPTELTAEAAPAWTRPVVAVPTLGLAALVGGQLPSFSARANLYVLVVGGLLMWLGLSGRASRPTPRGPGPGALWWTAPVGLFTVVEAVTFARGSTHDHPTFSLLMDPLLEDPLVRSVAYFAWLAAFWGLVRR